MVDIEQLYSRILTLNRILLELCMTLVFFVSIVAVFFTMGSGFIYYCDVIGNTQPLGNLIYNMYLLGIITMPLLMIIFMYGVAKPCMQDVLGFIDEYIRRGWD